MIDRQLRELVVRATNTGTSTLRGVHLTVTLPESLPIVGTEQTELLTLETIERSATQRTHRYVIDALPPGRTAMAHFPFRTVSMGTIEVKTMTATARLGSATVQAQRIF